MDPISTAILGYAVQQAADKLLEDLDATKRRIKEIDDKVDALLFGKLYTALNELREACPLTESAARMSKLDHAGRLFAEFDGDFLRYLERKRNSLKISFVKTLVESASTASLLGNEAVVFRELVRHAELERSLLIARIGAYKTAESVGDRDVIDLKRAACRDAVDQALRLLRDKRREFRKVFVAPHENKVTGALGKFAVLMAGGTVVGSLVLAKRKKLAAEVTQRKREFEAFLDGLHGLGRSPALQPR